jgi:hypothetical protein
MQDKPRGREHSTDGKLRGTGALRAILPGRKGTLAVSKARSATAIPAHPLRSTSSRWTETEAANPNASAIAELLEEQFAWTKKLRVQWGETYHARMIRPCGFGHRKFLISTTSLEFLPRVIARRLPSGDQR